MRVASVVFVLAISVAAPVAANCGDGDCVAGRGEGGHLERSGTGVTLSGHSMSFERSSDGELHVTGSGYTFNDDPDRSNTGNIRIDDSGNAVVSGRAVSGDDVCAGQCDAVSITD